MNNVFRYILYKLAQSRLVNFELRQRLLERLGLHAEDKVYIKHGCRFSHLDLSNVYMDKDVFVNEGCYFNNSGEIHIGSRTAIAMNVSIITATHEIATNYKRVQGEVKILDVLIGDGCWICANSTILPGTIIGNGSIIGAGSTVYEDVPDNRLYVSHQARQIDILK